MNVFESLMEAVSVGLWDLRLPEGPLTCNSQWRAITGWDERCGLSPDELRRIIPHADDAPSVQSRLAALIQGETECYVAQFRITRPDGDTIWLLEKAAVTEKDEQGRPCRISGLIEDITSFKQTEQRLLAETRYRELVAHQAGLGCWDWDMVNDHVIFNDDYRQMLGLSPEEMNGAPASLSRIIHPEDMPVMMRALHEHAENCGDSLFSMPIRVRTNKNDYIWILDFAMVVERDKDGRAMRMQGGVLDIDHTMRTEQQLREALREIAGYNEKLHSEVNEATYRLEQARRTTVAMFESNPHINLLFDSSYQLIGCNPAALDYLGFADKNSLSEGIDDLFSAHLPPRQALSGQAAKLADLLEQAARQHFMITETNLVIRGSRVCLNTIIKRIPYEDDFAIVMYLVDMTDLKKAQKGLLEQEHLLRAVNETASLLLADSHEDFNTILNQALRVLGECIGSDRAVLWKNFLEDERMFCALEGEWRRQPAGMRATFPQSFDYDAFIPDWRSLSLERSIMAGKADTLPSLARPLPGMHASAFVWLLPIHIQGEFWGFIEFDAYSEKSPATRAQTDILASGAMLLASAVERGELMDSLIRAKETAVNFTNAKSDFLSRMSHEIRTPMNAIIGMTAIARKSSDLEKIRESLDRADASSHQLLSIINDVLDMSKIESGKFELSAYEFSFENMLHNVFNVVQVKVDEKHQEFIVAFDAEPFTRTMVCDELRLSQVLINLLTNAVKFTPDMGRITLKIQETPLEPDQSMLRMEIIDSGIGMTPEQQKRLFTSFEQADGSITRRFGGTGLGLAICKTIITMMNGNIWVESEPDQGSKFIFEIRVGWGSPLEKNSASGLKHAPPRILVVDDSPETLHYFKKMLQSFSFPHDVAENGPQAIAMARRAMEASTPYDIIFLDWLMPGMNGGETAREIRRVMRGKEIVVMVSSMEWSEIEGEMAKLDIEDFLPKPVLPSTLFDIITRLTCALPSNRTMPGKTGPRWPGKRILLVEDIEINREIMLSLLEDTGLSIDCAEHGGQAVDMFREANGAYALIFMDVQMPVMDGLTATENIRASGLPSASTVPIIAMTANAFKEDVTRCIESGMNDHIAKPVDVDLLLEKLSSYLSNGNNGAPVSGRSSQGARPEASRHP